jgi:hypothetical protein
MAILSARERSRRTCFNKATTGLKDKYRCYLLFSVRSVVKFAFTRRFSTTAMPSVEMTNLWRVLRKTDLSATLRDDKPEALKQPRQQESGSRCQAANKGRL